MKNITVLIPCYNDWDCLNLLIPSIDKYINNININFDILIVNDSSTLKNNIKLNNIKNIKSINVLNLKNNVKAQVAIASGLEYLKNKDFDGGIIVMDADGQDDPENIIEIVENIRNNPLQTITINRLSRSETPTFIFFYYVYLFLTSVFILKNFRHGVYTYIHTKSLNQLFKDNSINYAYVGAVAKFLKYKFKIKKPRYKRYAGDSQNNFISLVNYALKILSIFKYRILVNSLIIGTVITYFLRFNILSLFVLCSLVSFNLIVFWVYFKNIKILKFDRMQNVSDIEKINF
jgi:hypothetical protein|tara:strand:- start:143 stop:1012 length:870 start_codon:yes stop_codon:yes gene_type:complete